ncbi:SIMPL domain-containing protein [Streptomyces sp. RFCAC02]|uniref:SIMPL domain-containing protein n=1 Tax=Streptomyces sp. RFCAC02 TaxID=2499143 RepID=UPI001020868B|nr:SIMPL domain-containing protein [Streptomyces sp. RFCAC02]
MNGITSAPGGHGGVTVHGTGTVRAVPDLARVNLSIRQTRQEPSEAFRETHALVALIRQVVRGHGVPDDAVATSRLNLRSSWSYGQDRRFLGYECAASFAVEVRDLDLLEPLLVQVVDAGAHQIDGVTFDVAARGELQSRARRSAVADARAKAELYAEAAGARLGAVTAIEDRDPAVPPSGYGAMTRSAAPAQPGGPGGEGDLIPGRLTIRSSVTATFALLV